MTIFSGVQPTGNIHLGNYLGAIKNFTKLQNENSLFCVVDLHALTTIHDPKILIKNIYEVVATYIASGLDPNKCIIFQQSKVLYHAQLAHIFNCITPIGQLNRMTQFKDKSDNDKENANIGLYTYPVLMASDILLYKSKYVPVGDDQKQHLNLTRDIANYFNNKFGKYFELPEPLFVDNGTRIMSLQDGTKKMSKSDPSELSRINLTDDENTIIRKLKRAKTDSELINQENMPPETLNLITLYSALSDTNLKENINKFEGCQYSKLKSDLIELTLEKILPINNEINKLLNDQIYLNEIIKNGSIKANHIAENNMKEINNLIGI